MENDSSVAQQATFAAEPPERAFCPHCRLPLDSGEGCHMAQPAMEQPKGDYLCAQGDHYFENGKCTACGTAQIDWRDAEIKRWREEFQRETLHVSELLRLLQLIDGALTHFESCGNSSISELRERIKMASLRPEQPSAETKKTARPARSSWIGERHEAR